MVDGGVAGVGPDWCGFVLTRGTAERELRGHCVLFWVDESVFAVVLEVFFVCRGVLFWNGGCRGGITVAEIWSLDDYALFDEVDGINIRDDGSNVVGILEVKGAG